MDGKYFAIILIGFFLVSGCISGNSSPQSGPQPSTTTLSTVQIGDYNGTRLTPAQDIPDNSIKGPQHVDLSTYRLKIGGLVKNPKSYTYGEVLAHQNYSKIVQLDCVEGWNATILWEGIRVKDLLDEAGPLPGAQTVIFHAVDNYTSGFPISYFADSNGTKNGIIMAFMMNNATLGEARGFPFQLVAESKWGYKWVKWIDEIDLSNDTNFRGYWENYGYSNDGSLNKSFLDRPSLPV